MRGATRMFLALAMVALALPNPARAAMTAEATRAALQQAIAERSRGDLDALIARTEPIIAAFEDMQKQQPAYCAENAPQALAILAQFVSSDSAKSGKSAIVVDQAFCMALFLKGFTLIDTGKNALAADFLRRAHETEPYNAQFLNEYAEWHKSAGQWQRAHDLFEQAYGLAEFANDADKPAYRARSLRGMGFTEIEMGQLDEAERHMKESLKFDPQNRGVPGELEYIARMRRKGKPNPPAVCAITRCRPPDRPDCPRSSAAPRQDRRRARG